MLAMLGWFTWPISNTIPCIQNTGTLNSNYTFTNCNKEEHGEIMANLMQETKIFENLLTYLEVSCWFPRPIKPWWAKFFPQILVESIFFPALSQPFITLLHLVSKHQILLILKIYTLLFFGYFSSNTIIFLDEKLKVGLLYKSTCIRSLGKLEFRIIQVDL